MITKFPESGVFFTSDTHFNHEAILRFCDRPFTSIQEHDKVLIDNWNSVVGPEDTVFHLGDFCFGGFPKWKEIREQLNGHIILIVGNHDDCNRTQGINTLFDHVTYAMRININGRTVYLNHYPYLCFAHWDPKLYGDNYAIALSGHTHIRNNNTGSDKEFTEKYLSTQYDVGVDFNNFKPVSWQEINEKIKYQIEHETNLTCWIK